MILPFKPGSSRTTKLENFFTCVESHAKRYFGEVKIHLGDQAILANSSGSLTSQTSTIWAGRISEKVVTEINDRSGGCETYDTALLYRNHGNEKS